MIPHVAAFVWRFPDLNDKVADALWFGVIGRSTTA